MERAMEMVASKVPADTFHFGVVRCDKDESTVLCEEALNMHTYPWAVFYHRGAWNLGTTWEFNDVRETWEATEPNVEHLRNFIMGWYQLKAREQHPFRLRFDPNNSLSRVLWYFVPAISFANVAEMMEFRKNAVIMVLVGAATLGFSVTALLKKTLC